MKRIIFLLLIVVCGISGCGNTDADQRSTFYTTFSIGEIVTKHKGFLLPASLPLSGTEAGPTAPPYQKHEEMVVQIKDVDVPGFMEAIKTDIAQAIIDSGARIEGQGGSFQDPVTGPADIDTISYRYGQGEANGIINLYGVCGEGTNYVLIVVLTEV